mmetsp:Transcript_29456/g.39348  ORF Transcript_29456/g.39348 Transcript_29456/m.39348 type:complete len:83 (+) Transcript_29456:102-350(+)
MTSTCSNPANQDPMIPANSKKTCMVHPWGQSWSLMHNERAYCVKAELGQNFLDPLHCAFVTFFLGFFVMLMCCFVLNASNDR